MSMVRNVTSNTTYMKNTLFLTCLFGLRLYVPINNFSVMSGHFSGLNQYYFLTCVGVVIKQ